MTTTLPTTEPRKTVFIDTNVFLNFYRFSAEQQTKLKDLLDYRDKGKIDLIITQQVVDEFTRRRETVLKDTLKRIKDFSPTFDVPVVCKDRKEATQIERNLGEIARLKKALVDKLELEIDREELPVDLLVKKCFSKTSSKMNEDIWNAARRRVQLGNPPGKEKSLGDALNWVTLLEVVPEGTDLHLITVDSDYQSVLNPENFSPFLIKEWEHLKKSKIHFFTSVLQFLHQNFPELKVTKKEIEEEKQSWFVLKPLSDLRFSGAAEAGFLPAGTGGADGYFISPDLMPFFPAYGLQRSVYSLPLGTLAMPTSDEDLLKQVQDKLVDPVFADKIRQSLRRNEEL